MAKLVTVCGVCAYVMIGLAKAAADAHLTAIAYDFFPLQQQHVRRKLRRERKGRVMVETAVMDVTPVQPR